MNSPGIAERHDGAEDGVASASEFDPRRDPYHVARIWATPNGDDLVAYMARVSNSKATPDDPSERLIGYLLRNHHWSPFQMVNLCLEVRTQRDISAQILRHASFSFQEFSTRYADVEELLHVTECRFQDTKNRQNSWSAEETVMHLEGVASAEEAEQEVERTISYFDAVVNETVVRSMEAYRELRSRGVAKEVARRILPIGLMPTKMYMNGNARSWLTYGMERTKAGVQKEHRLPAQAMMIEFALAFPKIALAAMGEGLFVGASVEFRDDFFAAAKFGDPKA